LLFNYQGYTGAQRYKLLAESEKQRIVFYH